MSEDIQRKLQTELDSFKKCSERSMISRIGLQKAIQTRQQLDGQLNENEIVKQELDLLPSDGKVYKSVGPVLIKTDLIEAKQNVSKRIDYITKEVKRVDDQIGTFEKKQDNHREALQKLQHQFQQAQVKAALHA
ncbi:hypothetical protein NQ314_001154 [Rhamnusium bicolor]|uniref:Probable prefoldin subunit 6 n=1 Tax=Rhamnusium bicolor TaxID=1586634 RepID=A0AAV8ZUC8_9CUCU|nr:hypothetical protein NQ314_001154 [Rhamnusium bicolor]